MSYVEIKCPHCSASGRVQNETNSPFMMGRCPVCGGYVVYFCGASLALDDDVFATHALETIRNHILARIDGWMEERLTEFLDEYAEEFEIDRTAAAPWGLEERVVGTEFTMQLDTEVTNTPPKTTPSIRCPDLPPLTHDDVCNLLRSEIAALGHGHMPT